MNRVTVGALCVAVWVFSLYEARRTRRTIGPFAFEQMERMFDVVENTLHAA